jgi:hypothetical protein
VPEQTLSGVPLRPAATAPLARPRPHPRRPQRLGDGGFTGKVRPRAPGAWAAADVIAAKRAEREARIQASTVNLAVAWGLSLMCGIGHLGHVWAGAPAWVHALHHPALSAAISAAALLGERRGAGAGRLGATRAGLANACTAALGALASASPAPPTTPSHPNPIQAPGARSWRPASRASRAAGPT